MLLKSCGFIFLFISLTGLIVPIQKNDRIEVLKKQILKNIPEELQNKKRGVVVEWK